MPSPATECSAQQRAGFLLPPAMASTCYASHVVEDNHKREQRWHTSDGHVWAAMQSPIGQTSRCERQSMPTMSPICRKAWPHRCSLNGGTADAPALQPTTLDVTHSATMATHATLGIVAAVVSQAEVGVPGDVGSAAWRSGVTKPSFARDWMAEGCSTKTRL